MNSELFSDERLEAALFDLSRRIDLDVDSFTSDTVRRVRTLPRAEQRRRGFRIIAGGRSRLLLVAAAIIAVLLCAVLVIPPSRDAIADLFGVDGLRITADNAIPSTTAAITTTTAAGAPATTGAVATSAASGFDAAAAGQALRLGRVASLSEARAALAGLRELPSSVYGSPSAVYISDRLPSLVSMVWAARDGLPGFEFAPSVGLLIQQYRSGSNDFIGKMLNAARSSVATVDGRTGYWVEGMHSIGYLDTGNMFVEDTLRWATNALVWASNGVTYRIESNLGKDEVLALAAALPRPG